MVTAKDLDLPDDGIPQSQFPGFSIPHNMKGGSVSPFRLAVASAFAHGQRPFEADAMAEAVGAAPFAEPERRPAARLRRLVLSATPFP